MAACTQAWNTGDLDGIVEAYATTPCFVVKDGQVLRHQNDVAMVTVRWRCRRPDGSTLWEFLDTCLLAAEQGRWRILGDVVHA